MGPAFADNIIISKCQEYNYSTSTLDGKYWIHARILMATTRSCSSIDDIIASDGARNNLVDLKDGVLAFKHLTSVLRFRL